MRCLIAVIACSLVAATPAAAQSRGELLYTTHCIACHTTQMHWRDKRSATNWVELNFQVRRWQSATSLEWSEGDILEVSRYLNDRIYHFEPTTDAASSMWLGEVRYVSSPHSLARRATLARSLIVKGHTKASALYFSEQYVEHPSALVALFSIFHFQSITP